MEEELLPLSTPVPSLLLSPRPLNPILTMSPSLRPWRPPASQPTFISLHTCIPHHPPASEAEGPSCHRSPRFQALQLPLPVAWRLLPRPSSSLTGIFTLTLLSCFPPSVYTCNHISSPKPRLPLLLRSSSLSPSLLLGVLGDTASSLPRAP